MIDAGKFFCPMCANVNTEAFYKEGSHNMGIRLIHNKFGGGFDVEGIHMEDGTVDPDGVELVSQLTPQTDADGIPERITVKFRGEEKAVDATRHCQFCAQNATNTKLFRDNGRYPLYVVAMVGDRDAGKTAWLDATSYPLNSAAVNEKNYPFKLHYVTVSGRYGKSEATPEYGRGATKFLEIINKGDNRVVAHVLLLDVAGELFLTTPEILERLTGGYMDYPGPDAFIFMESALSDSAKDTAIANALKAATIYDNCKAKGIFKNKPVAWVLTHLDSIIEHETYPKKRDSSGMIDLSVMSRNTFTTSTNYAPEILKDRLAIENYVAKSYLPTVLLDAPGSSNHGFLVQSCTTIDDPNLGLIEDRNQGINVMDPLLWVLHQLHIFPLKEGGFC